MYRIGGSYKSIVSLIIFLLLSSAAAAQEKIKKGEIKGKPVLWESVNVGRQNLFLGPGGEEWLPDLSRIIFVKKETGGYSTKYRIKDGAGHIWVAKVGKEAQSETSAVRFLWALGYKTEINYLVPKLTIPGKGTFTNVRLEARPDNVERLDEWKWKSNPFVGTKELNGLKIMMALMSNWDLKNQNNKIIYVKGSGERQYIISDLGATFGKTGNLPFFWRVQRSRNEPSDYLKTKFINEVEGKYINFNYGGRMRELFDNITVDDTRRIAALLLKLSDNQIRDAFRAANYSPSETEALSLEVEDRITQLADTAGLIKVPVENQNQR